MAQSSTLPSDRADTNGAGADDAAAAALAVCSTGVIAPWVSPGLVYVRSLGDDLEDVEDGEPWPVMRAGTAEAVLRGGEADADAEGPGAGLADAEEGAAAGTGATGYGAMAAGEMEPAGDDADADAAASMAATAIGGLCAAWRDVGVPD